MNVFMNECHLWMNKWFIEWISRSMFLSSGQDHFSVEKMHEFDVFNECVTDQQTEGHSLLQRCDVAYKNPKITPSERAQKVLYDT